MRYIPPSLIEHDDFLIVKLSDKIGDPYKFPVINIHGVYVYVYRPFVSHTCQNFITYESIRLINDVYDGII